MKIWKEIGSSHSTNVTIIGKFENIEDAKIIKPMIQDLVIGHESGMKDMQEFYNKWKDNIKNPFVYLTDNDFNDDPDARVFIEIKNNILKVEGSHLNRFFGIIKLMFAFNSSNIQITGTSN